MIQITQLLKLKFARRPVKTLLFSRVSLYPVLVFKGISHPNVTGRHHELSTSIKYFKRTLLLTLHIVGHFPKTILLPASSTKTLLHDQFLGFVSTMIKLAEGTFKILNLLQGFL